MKTRWSPGEEKHEAFLTLVTKLFASAAFFWVAAHGAAAATIAPAESPILSTGANAPLTFPITSLLSNGSSAMTVVSVASSSAQGGSLFFPGDGQPVWTNRYGGNQSNSSAIATSVAVDSKGNVYVTGHSGGTNLDYSTIKYLPHGTAVWTNRYNGPGNDNDYAATIFADSNGDVYVTGRSDNGLRSTSAFSSYATVKYSSDGRALWTTRYNGTGVNGSEAHALVVDDQHNVYVTGESSEKAGSLETLGFEAYPKRYGTIKYDRNGREVWTNRYTYDVARATAVATDIAIAPDGDLYVTGFTLGDESGCTTIKYTPEGTTVWTNRYPHFSGSPPRLAIDLSGNLYVSAGSAIVKYLADGTAVWTNQAGVKRIVLSSAGDIYGVGTFFASGSANSDFLTIKYSADGTALWTNYYNGPANSNDWVTAVAADAADNVYVTGSSARAGTPAGGDYVTIKYLSDGTPVWTNRYSGPGDQRDQPLALATDRSGNVYVTGYSYGLRSNLCCFGSSSDYATIKYSGGNEVLYTPPANFTGDDSFTYVVRDSAGQLATGTFSIAVGATRPVLSIQLGTDTVTIQWPTNFTGCVAEVAAPVVNTNSWITLAKMPVIAGTNYALTFPPTNRYQFFRLRSP